MNPHQGISSQDLFVFGHCFITSLWCLILFSKFLLYPSMGKFLAVVCSSCLWVSALSPYLFVTDLISKFMGKSTTG